MLHRTRAGTRRGCPRPRRQRRSHRAHVDAAQDLADAHASTALAVALDVTDAGDPAKAAPVIIGVVESGRAPDLLMLGTDAVPAYQKTLERHLAPLENWRTVGKSTSFEV